LRGGYPLPKSPEKPNTSADSHPSRPRITIQPVNEEDIRGSLIVGAVRNFNQTGFSQHLHLNRQAAPNWASAVK
jgi:hypothetical protein